MATYTGLLLQPTYCCSGCCSTVCRQVLEVNGQSSSQLTKAHAMSLPQKGAPEACSGRHQAPRLQIESRSKSTDPAFSIVTTEIVNYNLSLVPQLGALGSWKLICKIKDSPLSQESVKYCGRSTKYTRIQGEKSLSLFSICFGFIFHRGQRNQILMLGLGL